MSMGMQISDQSAEIERLNKKYKRAIKDKVAIYSEFSESIKELMQRNTRFLLNEVEAGRITNEASIIKRELEQRERNIEEVLKQISDLTLNDEALMDSLDAQIKVKITGLRAARKLQKDKESEVEFFEFISRQRDNELAEINERLQDQEREAQSSQTLSVNRSKV
jgi:hypothetical protein